APEPGPLPRPADPPPELAGALRRGGVHPLRDDRPGELWREAAYRLPLPDGFDREELARLLQSRGPAATVPAGGGVAVPDPGLPIVLPVRDPTVSLFYLRSPLELPSPDGCPIDALFVIISPTVAGHDRLLAGVRAALGDPAFRSAVQGQASEESVLELAERWEAPARRPRAAGRGGRDVL
ncbi:MAG TPA: hypothetical protein VIL46_11725, partial [Gemmataceae bacterium]